MTFEMAILEYASSLHVQHYVYNMFMFWQSNFY